MARASSCKEAVSCRSLATSIPKLISTCQALVTSAASSATLTEDASTKWRATTVQKTSLARSSMPKATRVFLADARCWPHATTTRRPRTTMAAVTLPLVKSLVATSRQHATTTKQPRSMTDPATSHRASATMSRVAPTHWRATSRMRPPSRMAAVTSRHVQALVAQMSQPATTTRMQ